MQSPSLRCDNIPILPYISFPPYLFPALIVHQRTRYEHLISQLRSEQKRLDVIVGEISAVEQQRTQNRRLPAPAAAVSLEDIGKLTAENRRLQIDIEYIGKEIADEKNSQLRGDTVAGRGVVDDGEDDA